MSLPKQPFLVSAATLDTLNKVKCTLIKWKAERSDEL